MHRTEKTEDVFVRGDFVQHKGLLAVVVGTGQDGGAPEDHLALWYGDLPGSSASNPEVWTVPAEYCQRAPEPEVRH